MKFTPWPMACLAATLVALCAATNAPAQDGSQAPTLPAELYQVEGPFTGDQQRAVDTFVDYYVNQLVNGSDTAVVTARTQLVSPLSKGGTAPFNQQYSGAVARRLAASPAMDSERRPYPPDAEEPTEQRGGIIVRLNAMVVTSRLLKDDAVLTLIHRGIADANPAVRYWAVRAVRGEMATLTDPQRQQLTAALQQMVTNEQADEVLRQLLLALVDLEAVDTVVTALNDLIRLHLADPHLTYDAKREAMRAALRKLTEMQAQYPGRNFGPAFRQLGRAAARYMVLITQHAQAVQLSNEVAADHVEMVKFCDTVLRAVHAQERSGAAAAPGVIQAVAARRDWAALHAAALTWRQVLMQQPFNFNEIDLLPAGR